MKLRVFNWYWLQALLLSMFPLTGFEVHGLYSMSGFTTTVDLHTTAAWAAISAYQETENEVRDTPSQILDQDIQGVI